MGESKERRAFLGSFLGGGLAAGLASMIGGAGGATRDRPGSLVGQDFAKGQHAPDVDSATGLRESFQRGPIRATIPVVGDGRWIWTGPPRDQTGYLEPRTYRLRLGIEFQGTGLATRIRATTVAPGPWPEQQIERFELQTHGCGARLRRLSAEAAQLLLAAPVIESGQRLAVQADYLLTLRKQYGGFERGSFPAEQPRYDKAFRKQYLYDSPGIQTRFADVRRVAGEVTERYSHPWDKVKAAYDWVWRNIEGRPQAYTSVVEALRDRVGDCEERAAVFVAFCRIAGIPSRLVWLPNHNWAEFHLADKEGRSHWIPAHTSAYSWFGWTGAHELVLQKGDCLRVPEQKRPQRLLADWMQWQGSRPHVRYQAELTPLPTAPSADAGPGARRKDERGEWVRLGRHPLDAYLRDGKLSGRRPPQHLCAATSGGG